MVPPPPPQWSFSQDSDGDEEDQCEDLLSAQYATYPQAQKIPCIVHSLTTGYTGSA